jgi:hypothetical protein
VKSFAGFLIIIAIVLLGIGSYRGWFVLSTAGRAGSNKVDVNLTVDPDQMKSDAKQASSLK